MTTSSPVDARKRALDSLSKLPPFSPILSKLMASLAGEDVSFAVLGDLIEKDTVVAANVLRIVNSAAYARRGTVNSVRRALSVLGVAKIRNIVLGMSISRMMNQTQPPVGWSMERFNQHSAAVAMLSDLLAQRVQSDYPEGAFVAGLLHDIGRLLIAMGVPHEYAEISTLYKQSNKSWLDCERIVLGFDHASLSADAMDAWKLPQPIHDAVLWHHEPPVGQPLARILHAANIYVDSLGHSIELEVHSDNDPLTAIQSLGLSSQAQQQILAQFQQEHTAIAQFYR
ncbi:MAG: HDOD domain-containing protein [Bryobacteraceae bacterium]